ncbi:hypothetical protein Ciccas_003180 [Cichlidogyrus casuarinus]|uniref:Uncharacterized protein n=1 Tax=Cichlidogyrus casuarinus TaxID=1844966 RepID=A0ABD2QF54_9PLAT
MFYFQRENGVLENPYEFGPEGTEVKAQLYRRQSLENAPLDDVSYRAVAEPPRSISSLGTPMTPNPGLYLRQQSVGDYQGNAQAFMQQQQQAMFQRQCVRLLQQYKGPNQMMSPRQMLSESFTASE